MSAIRVWLVGCVVLIAGVLTGDLPAAEPLQQGAEGPLVEALQRTLNAVVRSDRPLEVSGTFDAATEATLRTFQELRGLPANGVVTPATWDALGPIIERDQSAAVTSPRPRRATHSLDGPPFVTCRAWAICDAASGEVLWHHNGDAPRDMASTTKIMTAFLVIRYAVEHPEVLEEKIEFSERADRTIGSTADVRAGEQLTVRELLYGLLLPSGNDASVALAEHFGERLAPTDTDAKERENADLSRAERAYRGFIAAMNQTATELGMEETCYVNPHGLSAEKHKSSARDLLTLSRRALQIPLFAEIVNTRQYESVVRGREGYLRRLVWHNTNQLLNSEGYGGVKTGTTTQAGACLVSQGTRNGRSLLIAVLGSSSSDGRYADTLNLYRWAWLQLSSESEKAAIGAAAISD